MADAAPSMITGQSKAGDWRSAERVILPPIRDLHRIDVYEANGGYEALRAVVKDGKFDRAGLTEEVKASGLRGRGGAGFSTGLKWSFMPPVDPAKPRYLCCNGDESEPGTFKDRELLLRRAHLIVEGVILAGLITEATQGFIYIRHEYAEQIEACRAEIARAEQMGVCGEDAAVLGRSFPISVFVSPGGYICGEQSALIEAT